MNKQQIRTRFSIQKENRVAELQRQGYTLAAIAPIVNGSSAGVGWALKRHGRRWLCPGDPYCGRKKGFLSDSEVEDILQAYERGESISAIAADWKLTYSIVYGIVTGRSYTRRESDGFPFNFTSRPNRRIL